jgi:hypothetical protein
MARPDTERRCQIGYGSLIQEAFINHAHPTRHGCYRPPPCRRARRCLRPTAKTGAETRPFCGGRRRIERDVLRTRGAYGTHRTTINPRRANTREEQTVECGITRKPRTVARLPIKVRGQCLQMR